MIFDWKEAERERERQATQARFEAVVESASRRQKFMDMVAKELDRAYDKHGRAPWGRHEFYGILLEEVDELWADIKADAPDDQMLKEMVQVAAMCFRFFETGDRYAK